MLVALASNRSCPRAAGVRPVAVTRMVAPAVAVDGDRARPDPALAMASGITMTGMRSATSNARNELLTRGGRVGPGFEEERTESGAAL
jgi:hypothetical protein